MVQVINSPSSANLFSQMAGQGVVEGLGQGVDILLRKKGINNAFQGLNNQQSSPIDLLKGLIDASVYSPEIGKNLGALYGETMKYRGAENQGQNIRNSSLLPQASSQFNGDQQEDSFSENTNKNNAPSKIVLKDAKPAEDYLRQVRPELFEENGWGKIPKPDFSKKQFLTPEEKAGIYDKLKHLPIERREQVINTIEEGVQNQYKENVSKYGFTKEEQAARDEKIREASHLALPELEPIFSQQKNNGVPSSSTIRELNQNFNRYLAAQPDYLTPQQMASNATQLVQRDNNMLNVVRALPSMPPIQRFDSAKDMIKDYSEAYKPLKELGYIDALKEDAIYNKDLGTEGMHAAIWGDDMSPETVKSISKVKPPIRNKGFISDFNNLLGVGKEDNSYKSLSKKLVDIQPNDDLILLRAMALDNGFDEREFTKALNEAQKSGLELSPFQKSQIPELGIARKIPLWEIFKEGPSNWVNYFRGKK